MVAAAPGSPSGSDSTAPKEGGATNAPTPTRSLKPLFCNEDKDAAQEVVLHVYDLSDDKILRAANEVFSRLGTGAFHVGVEVFGREWSYGYKEGGATGVFHSKPGRCPARSYRQGIKLGRTSLDSNEVLAVLAQLRKEWLGCHYDPVRHNCGHFCDEFCSRLLVEGVPKWVANLANVGAAVKDVFDGLRKAGSLVEAAAVVAATNAGGRPQIRL